MLGLDTGQILSSLESKPYPSNWIGIEYFLFEYYNLYFVINRKNKQFNENEKLS